MPVIQASYKEHAKPNDQLVRAYIRYFLRCDVCQLESTRFDRIEEAITFLGKEWMVVAMPPRTTLLGCSKCRKKIGGREKQHKRLLDKMMLSEKGPGCQK